MTNKPMLSVERELLERLLRVGLNAVGVGCKTPAEELRALLDKPKCCEVSAADQALLDSGDYTPEELFGAGGKPSCPDCSKPAAQHQGNPEGKRERFEKWVMATKHPVYGFLDGRSLARGDDREGYADEYVQGLWVAYCEFAAQPQGEPVAYRWRVVGRREWTFSDCNVEFDARSNDDRFEAQALYAEQPAPVAVVMPERMKFSSKASDYAWAHGDVME